MFPQEMVRQQIQAVLTSLLLGLLFLFLSLFIVSLNDNDPRRAPNASAERPEVNHE